MVVALRTTRPNPIYSIYHLFIHSFVPSHVDDDSDCKWEEERGGSTYRLLSTDWVRHMRLRLTSSITVIDTNETDLLGLHPSLPNFSTGVVQGMLDLI